MNASKRTAATLLRQAVIGNGLLDRMLHRFHASAVDRQADSAHKNQHGDAYPNPQPPTRRFHISVPHDLFSATFVAELEAVAQVLLAVRALCV
jgi:hypothetical protein